MSDFSIIKFRFREASESLNRGLDSFSKQKDIFEIEESSKSGELATVLGIYKACVIIVSIVTKDDLAELVLFSKKDSLILSGVKIKYIVIDRFQGSSLNATLARLGINDILPGSFNPVTLKRKLDIYFQPLLKGETSSSEVSPQQSKAQAENLAKKERSRIEWLPPLPVEDDFWIVEDESKCKSVLSNWAIMAMGPSTKIGRWEKLTSTSWFFDVFPEEKEIFSVSEGRWVIVASKQPEISWDDKSWMFQGSSIELYFEAKSGRHSKIKASRGKIQIAQSSIHAQVKKELIFESFDSKYIFTSQNIKKEAEDISVEENSSVVLEARFDDNSSEGIIGGKLNDVINPSPLLQEALKKEKSGNTPSDLEKESNNSQSAWNDGTKNASGSNETGDISLGLAPESSQLSQKASSHRNSKLLDQKSDQNLPDGELGPYVPKGKEAVEEASRPKKALASDLEISPEKDASRPEEDQGEGPLKKGPAQTKKGPRNKSDDSEEPEDEFDTDEDRPSNKNSTKTRERELKKARENASPSSRERMSEAPEEKGPKNHGEREVLRESVQPKEIERAKGTKKEPRAIDSKDTENETKLDEESSEEVRKAQGLRPPITREKKENSEDPRESKEAEKEGEGDKSSRSPRENTSKENPTKEHERRDKPEKASGSDEADTEESPLDKKDIDPAARTQKRNSLAKKLRSLTEKERPAGAKPSPEEFQKEMKEVEEITDLLNTEQSSRGRLTTSFGSFECSLFDASEDKLVVLTNTRPPETLEAIHVSLDFSTIEGTHLFEVDARVEDIVKSDEMFIITFIVNDPFKGHIDDFFRAIEPHQSFLEQHFLSARKVE